MALEKRVETGEITILADGQLQIRTDTIVLEGGIEIARSTHQTVLDPATIDRASLAGRVRQVADVLWTPAVIAARRAAIAQVQTRR